MILNYSCRLDKRWFLLLCYSTLRHCENTYPLIRMYKSACKKTGLGAGQVDNFKGFLPLAAISSISSQESSYIQAKAYNTQTGGKCASSSMELTPIIELYDQCRCRTDGIHLWSGKSQHNGWNLVFLFIHARIHLHEKQLGFGNHVEYSPHKNLRSIFDALIVHAQFKLKIERIYQGHIQVCL